jgi:hypothetical protein
MAEPGESQKNNPKQSLSEAGFWLAFAALAYVLAIDFDKPLPTFVLGAAHWPHVIITVILISASVLIASQFLHGAPKLVDDVTDQVFDEAENNVGPLSIQTIAMFILPLLWVYGMHKLGFLVITPFFLLICTWVMGVRSWKVLLAFTAGFYAVTVFVFYKLIFTPLPMGAGWFHSLNGEIIGLIQ